MLKRVISAVIGTRHEREARRIKPIVDAIPEQGERLKALTEAELRGQTEKLRAIVRERTVELEAQVAELKAKKHGAADAAEREAIDAELNGADGKSGAEGALRTAIADALDEILPEAFAT